MPILVQAPTNEVLPAEISPSTVYTSSVTTSTTSESIASAEAASKMEENYEKLLKVANILDIALPCMQNMDPKSARFRKKEAEQAKSSLNNAIKALFPVSIKDLEDDIVEISSNIKSVLQYSDTEKQIELLKILPWRWTRTKLEAWITIHGYVMIPVTAIFGPLF